MINLLNNIEGWVHNGYAGNHLQMALNSNVFGGKEFEVYIGADFASDTSDVGTFHTSTNSVSMQRLDVEGVTVPSFSPNQEFEMRTGSGRTAQFDQIFSSSKRVTTEVSLSGRLTTADLPIFMENVLSQAGTENDNLFEILHNYAPTPFKHGDTGDVTGFERSLSLFFKAPNVDDCVKLKGCVVTSLSISGDMGTASGRFNYDVTLQTQYAPEFASVSVTSAQSIGSTKLFLSDMTEREMNIKDYDTSDTDQNAITPLFNNMTLTIESPTQFLGAQGTNAEPEVFARAVPELTVTVAGSIKYDTETAKLVEAFHDAGNDSSVQLYMNNRAISNSFADLSTIAIANHTEQLFGFIVPKAKITSAEVSSDDIASVNFEMKVLSPGSNKFIHIATGATATS
jgi:hypothetical protein